MADTELKPCPFCGASARIESNRDWHKLIADCDDDCVLADGEPVAVAPAYDEYRVRLAEEWNRRATPPSPSTAPEVDGDPLADLQRFGMAKLEVGHPAHYAGEFVRLSDVRAALASRPAEVDDEGLPPLPSTRMIGQNHLGFIYGYTAEQYRQGQRDAVAADRARRGGQP